MARIPDLKRLQKENFTSEQQPLVEKLAYPINTFMEQTVNALNGRLDFSNINMELINLDVTVDSGGEPVVITKFKTNLKSNVAGVVCINASNITDPTTYPTSQPFVSIAQNGSIITVKHISGLQANNRYDLRLLSIGF